MSQHFLLSAKARTLSLAHVMRLAEDEAYGAFKEIRWAESDGEPFCPRCGCVAVYEYRSRRIFKCKGCGSQFSVTTGTIFASRKLPIRNLLAAIAIFVNGAKGISALQLSRDLNVQYKTAFVLAHKLREAMGDEMKARRLGGHIEIDGAYFGGYVRPENRKDERRDRRLAIHQSGKRRVVVVMRERQGRTLPFVFRSEDESLPTIQARALHGSTIYADEASCWDELHARFATRRVNHSVAFRDEDACTTCASPRASPRTSPRASPLFVAFSLGPGADFVGCRLPPLATGISAPVDFARHHERPQVGLDFAAGQLEAIILEHVGQLPDLDSVPVILDHGLALLPEPGNQTEDGPPFDFLNLPSFQIIEEGQHVARMMKVNRALEPVVRLDHLQRPARSLVVCLEEEAVP
ncbi:MAG: IS1595 family transposase, partial [Proteobacteria bacterium]|nr:IS1595 family transposase [Pseudomonadota bacterium]